MVGVASVGALQNVKILSTEQTGRLAASRLRTTLESLAGARRGTKVGAWRRWWDQNEKRLLQARATRYRQAAADDTTPERD